MLDSLGIHFDKIKMVLMGLMVLVFLKLSLVLWKHLKLRLRLQEVRARLVALLPIKTSSSPAQEVQLNVRAASVRRVSPLAQEVQPVYPHSLYKNKHLLSKKELIELLGY